MFDLRFDLTDLEKQARALGTAEDQIPFMLSLALNAAAKSTKQKLVEDTWPQHVTQRNSSFIRRALQIDYAMKYNLRVEIYDDLNRAHLNLHAEGGTERPRKGRFAVPPTGSVTRTAQGVRKSQRPAAIIASTPKRALRITARGIFVGIAGKLKLKFSLLPSVQQPKDVPFVEDFQEAMRNELRASMPTAMARAMRPRP